MKPSFSLFEQVPLYRYMATVIRVIDGDTAELVIDIGFKHTWKISCRLAGINAPELRAEDEAEQEKAQAAKNYLTERIGPGTRIYIISEKLDKYGRPIVTVFDASGINVNEDMLQHGYAKKYAA